MALSMFMIQCIFAFPLISYSSSQMFLKGHNPINNKVYESGFAIVNPGESISITCPVSNSTWTFAGIDNGLSLNKVKFDNRVTKSDKTLDIKDITFNDAGIYYCESGGKNYLFALHVYKITGKKNGSAPIKEIHESINNIDFVQKKIDEKESSHVSCSCDTGSAKVGGDISWRGGQYTKLSNKYRIDTVRNGTEVTKTLTLIKSDNSPEYYGEYICTCFVISKSEQKESVYLKTPPIFKESEGSLRTGEGKTVILECEVWGYPPIDENSLEWRFQNQTIRKGITISDKNASRSGYISLTIPDISQTDRGLYTCHATNEVSSNTMGIMVRVKSKYAAIWPLIGIIVQLIILAIIIIVYEMKKKKQSVDDGVPPQTNVDSANTVDKVGDSSEVRQRLVKA